RTAAYAWLLAHHVTVAIPGGGLTLAPLGLTVLAGYLLVRAGAWAGRALKGYDGAVALACGLVYALVYALLTAPVAAAVAKGAVRPDAVQAAGRGLVFAAVLGGAGVAAGTGGLGAAAARLPAAVRSALYAG